MAKTLKRSLLAVLACLFALCMLFPVVWGGYS